MKCCDKGILTLTVFNQKQLAHNNCLALIAICIMKKLLPLLFCCGLIACHTTNTSLLSNYLNTSNLPAQSFTINPNVDTTLMSAGGVRIAIAKGTFSSDQPVAIEWKEALDFQSILTAGLTTQNGKNILRSGGMFYFNTKEKLAIQKPIGIDVPTETIASGMQLYKGDSSDGKLDWKEPKPIENVRAFGENAAGKALFENNCASCHRIDNDLTGPALAGYKKRGPWMDKQKLYEWTRNPTGFMATDKYTQCLKCRYSSIMQGIRLSDKALDSLYKYIDDTQNKQVSFSETAASSNCDTCIFYRSIYNSLLKKRDSLQANNNNTIDIEYNLPPKITPSVGVEFLERKSDYYRLTIDATGWYNVDALLEMSGTVKSKLVVKLQGASSDKQEIYLAIPSVKVVGQGGYLGNSSDIGFAYSDGSIPLPQQQKAFVFAIGEQKGKFFYSRKDFITSTNQTIYLTAQEFSKKQFDLKILELQQNGLSTIADTTFRFSNLKSVDEKLDKIMNEKLKDCGCTDGLSRDSITSK